MSEPFAIEFKDFNKTFYPLVQKKIPASGAKGLFNAFGQMLQDADKVAPYTPFLKGDLKGAKVIERPKITEDLITVKGGYNIDYARKLHELPKAQARRRAWSLPGSGRKWLQTKMFRFKEKYIGIAAKTIDDTRV